MIFGRTKEQRTVSEQARIVKRITGARKFAFPLPVMIEDGRLVWCQTYYEYTDGGLHKDGRYSLISVSDDYLIPRVRRYLNESDEHIKIQQVF